LHPGDSFGELALLHNTKRTASIICSGTSEFLRVDKPDFDDVWIHLFICFDVVKVKIFMD